MSASGDSCPVLRKGDKSCRAKGDEQLLGSPVPLPGLDRVSPGSSGSSLPLAVGARSTWHPLDCTGGNS